MSCIVVFIVEQLSMALGEKENEVVVAKRKQAGSLKVCIVLTPNLP